MVKYIVLCLCLILAKQAIAETSLTVSEVQAGDLVELICLSSDDDHQFMFWQLADDKYIIGPGNPLDESKYNYEVLTGKLYIREISTDESGFYKCISREIRNNSDVNIHIVELIVKSDMQELEDNSFETNLLRGMALIMFMIVSIAIILLIIMVKRRRAEQQFFDLLEESRENSPEKHAGYVHSASMLRTPSARATLPPGGIDNVAFDVDYPKVFQQIKRGQTIPF